MLIPNFVSLFLAKLYSIFILFFEFVKRSFAHFVNICLQRVIIDNLF